MTVTSKGGARAVILEEATGTETINKTFTRMDFDTTVRADTDMFTLVGSPVNRVRVLEAGKYLCGYSIGVNDITPVDRAAFRSQLAVGAAGQKWGISGGYCRDSQGAKECNPNGVAILSLSQNDELEVQIKRIDSNAGVWQRNVAADAGGFWLVRLNDDFDYFRARDTATTTLTTGSTRIQWGAVDEQDGDFSVSSGVITCPDNSHILVCVNVRVDNTSGTRGNAWMFVRDPVTTAVEYARVTRNIRSIQGCDHQDLSAVFVLDTNSVDNDIEVGIRKEGGSQTMTLGGESAIAMVKLRQAPPTLGNFCNIRENAGGQRADQTGSNTFGFDTADEEDTDLYDHNPGALGDHLVEHNGADGELFFVCSSMFADRTADSNQRIVPRHRGFLDGTGFNYGHHGVYNRGSANNRASGSSGGFIFEANAGQDFHWDSLNRTTGTDANCTYQSDLCFAQFFSITEQMPICLFNDETVEVAEQYLLPRDLVRVINEAVEVSDAYIAFRNRKIILNETVQVSDAYLTSRQLVRVIGDTIEVSDAYLTPRIRVIIINEGVTVADAYLTPRQLVRVVNEAVSVSDAYLTPRNLVRVINEAVEVSDQYLLPRVRVVVINEAVEVAEAFLTARQLVRVLNETVNVSDTYVTVVTAVGAPIIVINESVNVSESIITVLRRGGFTCRGITLE